jgi:primosomal protein N' (replication factor Y) (superfamily II helicase)
MVKKVQKFIIDVVPLTRITLSRQQFFSYEWNEKIPAGSLVLVPLFRRTLEGIVVNCRSDFERLGNIKLKKINNIIEDNFLTDNQLKLAQFISDYYIYSLGVVLKFFVPKRVKSRNPKPITQNLISKKIILTKEQEKAVKVIITGYRLPATSFLLFGLASSGKTEVYIHAIAKISAQGGSASGGKDQFLILLPELTLTPQALERYGAIFKTEEMAVIHSKISKGELYSAWQKIKSGKVKLIIGTRMAIFAPFQNLKLIVIDEEQDISFKQWDMSPRYDARMVAEKLAEIYKAKIVRGSATPSVESFYKAINKEYELIKLPKLQVAGYKLPITDFEIVDMRKERWTKNFSPISKKLRSEIGYALKNKLQTILFINRQGMSSFSICTKCKTVLRCPKCDRALIYENDGTYKCLHCSYKSDALIDCRKCHGLVFRNIGLGTQKVERELNNIFPGARLKRVDFEAMQKKNSAADLYREFSRGDYDILIGTQMITKGWDNPRVGLVGIVDADNLLTIPDFRSGEKAFQVLVQVAGRTSRLGSTFPGKIIIQTFNPDNFVIKTAAEMDWVKFYENEIKERELLHYPPFNRIIKLVYQHENRTGVDFEAKKLYDEIKGRFEKNQEIKITMPQNPLVSRVRGKFKKQIIINFKNILPRPLKKIIKKLDHKWIIDVDPINIV